MLKPVNGYEKYRLKGFGCNDKWAIIDKSISLDDVEPLF